MKTKHTPGDWGVNLNGGEHGQHAITVDMPGYEKNGQWRAVATIHIGRLGNGTSPIQTNEAEANARLIAAAPDLLEACKGALAFMDERGYGGDVYRVLRGAIAKAVV